MCSCRTRPTGPNVGLGITRRARWRGAGGSKARSATADHSPAGATRRAMRSASLPDPVPGMRRSDLIQRRHEERFLFGDRRRPRARPPYPPNIWENACPKGLAFCQRDDTLYVVAEEVLDEARGL